MMLPMIFWSISTPSMIWGYKMLYCTECPLREECRPLQRYWDEAKEQGVNPHPSERYDPPHFNMDACPLYAIMRVSED